MKFTITRINKQNKLMVSSKTIERFLERIAKDDAKLSVTNFRMSVPLMEPATSTTKASRNGSTFIQPQNSTRMKAAISSSRNQTGW